MDKGDRMEYSMFIQLHKLQLESSLVPTHFWPDLYKKLYDQRFDAGDFFTVFKIDYGKTERTARDPLHKVVVTKEEGLNVNDGSNIFLVDHAWTYHATHSVNNLVEIPGLLNRMCNLMGIPDDLPEFEKISQVRTDMWLYSQTYSHCGVQVEDRIPLWYIMDEFGSAIQHSDEPNCRTVPFYNLMDCVVYSLFFPIKSLNVNDEVTRDYVEGDLSKDPEGRKALLLPWKPLSFCKTSYSHFNPGVEYFSSSRILESLPDNELDGKCTNTKLKVYSDYEFVVSHLKNENFELVNEIEEADILWLTRHFKNYKVFSTEFPTKFINQFPYENVLTVKDLLCIVCRRKGVTDNNNGSPDWLPITYNLQTELVQFCSYFQFREAKGFDNHWICKPWNLARGLDMYISNNINCIMRLPFTGPKIAQKYIENPVLFYRPGIGLVKFDIRYVVLLKSVKPLQVYAYRNFFLRFANKPFELSDFDDYEKHFTVMNYTPTELCKMLCNEFVDEFYKQNSEHKWEEVEKLIFNCLREVFEASVMEAPPCGIAESRQSRSIYAVDLMLSWTEDRDIQPKLLEVNWVPDCQRACIYYPEFFNDIFLLLFKDIENKEKFQTL